MNCLVCLEEAEGAYHRRCLRALFGTDTTPAIDVDLAKLHTLALAMVGHTSLTGVQRKISVGLSVGRGATLHVEAEGGRYILKPQAHVFPATPENEHVTMRIAAAFGLSVPSFGLVRLRDGSLAYVVRRFDRLEDGRKLAQEDFCQLAEKSPKEKYDGSAELSIRLVRRYASEPLIELLELYRRLVFIWWTGNGDMHLKNFSLLTGADGLHRLSPVYDLLCTRLVIPDDRLALPFAGKNDRLTKRIWRELAAYAGLPEAAAARVHAKVGATLEKAVALVRASYLPEDQKRTYESLLRARAKGFAG